MLIEYGAESPGASSWMKPLWRSSAIRPPTTASAGQGGRLGELLGRGQRVAEMNA